MALTYKGKANRRSDGKAVDLVVPAGQSWEAGDPVYAQGFHGFAMAAGAAGTVVAVEIEQSVWEMELPAGVTGAKGDLVYISTDGANTITGASGAGNTAFAKVVLAKDSNNTAYVRHLEAR
jgi:hypothetical protein